MFTETLARACHSILRIANTLARNQHNYIVRPGCPRRPLHLPLIHRQQRMRQTRCDSMFVLRHQRPNVNSGTGLRVDRTIPEAIVAPDC
jgi:hypothetical protein